MSLEAANREVYLLLKEGIKVSVPDRERGGQKTERLRVIDWEQPANDANSELRISTVESRLSNWLEFDIRTSAFELPPACRWWSSS
jgi:hypothetical protein